MQDTPTESMYPENFIRFLGTAGTRFVMLSQRRASGGLWFSYGGVRGVIDPGPGSLVQICKASPPLSPIDINTLILTHRHVDHSSDLSVLAEGMTLKCAEKRGQVLLTKDSMEEYDTVLLNYVAKKIRHIHHHKNGRRAELAPGVTVESVKHRHHGVQCYGLVFRSDGLPTWGIISDSQAMPYFPERYAECRLLIVNVTLPYHWGRLDHLSVPDVASLLQQISPKIVLLTHMGGQLLDRGPQNVAAQLATEQSEVVAAEDGMVVDLGSLIYGRN